MHSARELQKVLLKGTQYTTSLLHKQLNSSCVSNPVTEGILNSFFVGQLTSQVDLMPRPNCAVGIRKWRFHSENVLNRLRPH